MIWYCSSCLLLLSLFGLFVLFLGLLYLDAQAASASSSPSVIAECYRRRRSFGRTCLFRIRNTGQSYFQIGLASSACLRI